MKRYWFELTDEHYNDLGAAISDGWQKSPAIAEAKRWMKENGVKATILVCNSMATDNPTSGGIRQSLKEIGIRLGVLEDTNANLKESMRQRNSDLADFLIGKAHAYDDTDFRKEAVRLAGEVEVVKRTIELGLPLWDEDRKVVLSMIEEQGK